VRGSGNWGAESEQVSLGFQAQFALNTPGAREKPLANRQKTCKSKKQDENEQNYTEEPTQVVGKKPNGKSQLNTVNDKSVGKKLWYVNLRHCQDA